MMKNYRNTDPEFAERVEHFAFDEVVNEPGQQLDEVTRHMAILATLLGCQGTEVFRRELPQALDAGDGQGDRLSGGGLPGNGPGAPLPGYHQ